MNCPNQQANPFYQWLEYVKVILENGNTPNQRQIMYTGSNGHDLWLFGNACIAVKKDDDGNETCFIDSATDYIQVYVGDIVYYDEHNKVKRLSLYNSDYQKQQQFIRDLAHYSNFCKEFAHKNAFAKIVDTLQFKLIKLNDNQTRDGLRNCIQLIVNNQPIAENDWFNTLVASTAIITNTVDPSNK